MFTNLILLCLHMQIHYFAPDPTPLNSAAGKNKESNEEEVSDAVVIQTDTPKENPTTQQNEPERPDSIKVEQAKQIQKMKLAQQALIEQQNLAKIIRSIKTYDEIAEQSQQKQQNNLEDNQPKPKVETEISETNVNNNNNSFKNEIVNILNDEGSEIYLASNKYYEDHQGRPFIKLTLKYASEENNTDVSEQNKSFSQANENTIHRDTNKSIKYVEMITKKNTKKPNLFGLELDTSNSNSTLAKTNMNLTSYSDEVKNNQEVKYQTKTIGEKEKETTVLKPMERFLKYSRGLSAEIRNYLNGMEASIKNDKSSIVRVEKSNKDEVNKKLNQEKTVKTNTKDDGSEYEGYITKIYRVEKNGKKKVVFAHSVNDKGETEIQTSNFSSSSSDEDESDKAKSTDEKNKNITTDKKEANNKKESNDKKENTNVNKTKNVKTDEKFNNDIKEKKTDEKNKKEKKGKNENDNKKNTKEDEDEKEDEKEDEESWYKKKSTIIVIVSVVVLIIACGVGYSLYNKN